MAKLRVGDVYQNKERKEWERKIEVVRPDTECPTDVNKKRIFYSYRISKGEFIMATSYVRAAKFIKWGKKKK